MAEIKKSFKSSSKPKDLNWPIPSPHPSIIGTQEMIARAQKLGIDTVFDRAAQMKPCNIGIQGICCKNCAMGPCRLPLPKGRHRRQRHPQRAFAAPPPTPLRPVTSSA
jgi:carbon-monoxide dehydrogenase catalytic subunit